MKTDKRILVFSLIAILVAGYVFILPIQVAGATTSGSNTAEASTPYGESIGITIGSGGSTSGEASIIDIAKIASWVASYSDTDTQNVYDVDGTYKQQEQVTLSYSLSISHSSVTDIKATVKIKATQSGTPTNTNEYTLANQKTLSGTSPISDTGSTTRSIGDHLVTDIGAPASGATILYEIYCQVTATGAVSGETLTATVSYTQFGNLQYTRTSESSSATVTPSVGVTSIVEYKASAVDNLIGLPDGATLLLTGIAIVILVAKVVKQRWL